MPLITSDLVLVELLNGSSAPRRRAAAAEVARRLLADPRVSVIELDRASLVAAITLYESRPDKEWSIVDCWSMLICADRGVHRVFTADHHFRQAGFDILL